MLVGGHQRSGINLKHIMLRIDIGTGGEKTQKPAFREPEENAGVENLVPIPRRETVLKAPIKPPIIHWLLVPDDRRAKPFALDRHGFRATAGLDNPSICTRNAEEVQ